MERRPKSVGGGCGAAGLLLQREGPPGRQLQRVVRPQPHVLALGGVGPADAQRGAVGVVVDARGAQAQRHLDALRGASSPGGASCVPAAAAASGRGDLAEGAGRDEVPCPDEVEGVPYVLGCFDVRREREREREREKE